MSRHQSLGRTGSDGTGDTAPTALTAGGAAATVLSAAGSLVAYGSLPETVRIHWTLGAGPYYGPEHAPAVLVLVGFPALVVGLAVGARLLAARLRAAGTFDGRSPYYTLLVLAAFVGVLAVQAVVLGANL